MSKIICLIDGNTKIWKDFFIHRLLTLKGYNSVFLGVDNLKQRDLDKKYFHLLLHIKYFWAAFKCVLKSSKSDIIISWLDIMGVYLFFIAKALFKKRKILILNIMNPPNKNLYSILRDRIYHIVLKSKYCYPTVNSTALIPIYQKSLNLKNKEFFLLHDSIDSYDVYKSDYQKGNNYIFFGGTAGRDYEMILEVARRLEEIDFIFVVRKKYFYISKDIPKNVKIFFDLPAEEFYDLMRYSNLILLPIKVDTPAGIIVLLIAGFMSKLVIASNTITINEYITHNYNGILINNSERDLWINTIKKTFNDFPLQEKLGKQLKLSVEEMTSHNLYVDNILKIINTIDKAEKYLI